MEFKRYDGFFNGAPQKKFDNELPLCPFCGENPHWNLNIKNGFSASVTCMCEKCKGKLNTEYTILNIDNLRVVDVGEKNLNNLTLNGVYNIMALNSLAKNTNSAENKNRFFENNTSQNITYNVESNNTTKNKRNGAIIGIISFIIVFCLFLWIIIPFSTNNSSSRQLQPVEKSNMSVEESFGYYYVTITGSAKNTSRKTMDYVSITFTLYDSAGNVVGTALDNQSGLGAGETWIYSAIGISTTNIPVSWKSTDITVIYY